MNILLLAARYVAQGVGACDPSARQCEGAGRTYLGGGGQTLVTTEVTCCTVPTKPWRLQQMELTTDVTCL